MSINIFQTGPIQNCFLQPCTAQTIQGYVPLDHVLCWKGFAFGVNRGQTRTSLGNAACTVTYSCNVPTKTKHAKPTIVMHVAAIIHAAAIITCAAIVTHAATIVIHAAVIIYIYSVVIIHTAAIMHAAATYINIHMPCKSHFYNSCR